LTIKIVIDGRDHANVAWSGTKGRCCAVFDYASAHGLNFDSFASRLLGDVGEVGDSFAAPSIVNFVPLEVVGALGVVFIAAQDCDVVAYDLAVALDDIGEAPSLTNLDVLEDLDPVRVLLRLSRHLASPPVRGWKIDRVVNSGKFGNGMDGVEGVDGIGSDFIDRKGITRRKQKKAVRGQRSNQLNYVPTRQINEMRNRQYLCGAARIAYIAQSAPDDPDCFQSGRNR